jgi:hypothetical protein
VLVFICLVALCTASAVINRFQSVDQRGLAWYLNGPGTSSETESEQGSSVLEVWLTFLILYSSLVP